MSVNGTPLVGDDVAVPCGLTAQTFFNDEYSLFINTLEVEIDSSDIAWKSDINFKFKNQGEGWEAKQWLDMEDRKFTCLKLTFCRTFYRLDENCWFT